MASLYELEGDYILDPMHTRIGFASRHAMVTTLRGSFDEFDGTASIRAGGVDGRIDLVLQVASINTRIRERDAHLCGTDFFDAATFPTITYRSTEVSVASERMLHVVGDLTIKGETHAVAIDFRYGGTSIDHLGSVRIGFGGATEILRSDWGVSYNAVLETGGVLISDETLLEFEVSAVRRRQF